MYFSFFSFLSLPSDTHEAAGKCTQHFYHLFMSFLSLPVDTHETAGKCMQHVSCVGVLHADSVTSNGQALPQHRLSPLEQALGLQREGHLLEGVGHIQMVQPQSCLLYRQTGLQRLIGLQGMNLGSRKWWV